MAERNDWIIPFSPEQLAELEAAARPLVSQGEEVTRVLPHLTAGPTFRCPPSRHCSRP